MKTFAGLFFVVMILLSSSTAFAVCNTPPVAQPNVYNVAMNGNVTIFYSDLVANDTDANGDSLTARVVGSPNPPIGSYCCSVPANSVRYIPPANFKGLISIPSEVSDGCNVVSGTILVFVQ